MITDFPTKNQRCRVLFIYVNITQFFGAPYSTPSILRVTLTGRDSVRSERVRGTAIWNHQIIRGGSVDLLLSMTQKQWKEFSASHQMIAVNMKISGMNDANDDFSVLIKLQQGATGGVLGGNACHMGYVRDQYGVSRRLLAMGHTGEAKKILEFYFQNWQKSGFLKNAHAIGFPHIFH